MIHTVHRRGSVCAAVLLTHDVARAVSFYEALLQVTSEELEGSQPRLCVLRVEGKTVAFVRHAPGRNEWLPFVSVDDLDAAAAAAASLGAAVTERADAHGFARMATIVDPEGARLGLWQPAPVEGVELTEAPGGLWWAEVLSDDPPRARQFYRELFGWRCRETAFAPFAAYTVFERDGTQEGGVLPIGPDWGVSPHWNAIYEVTDADDVLQRACDLGGAAGFVHTVPRHGRIGSIIDPAGATFCVRGPVPHIFAAGADSHE